MTLMMVIAMKYYTQMKNESKSKKVARKSPSRKRGASGVLSGPERIGKGKGWSKGNFESKCIMILKG